MMMTVEKQSLQPTQEIPENAKWEDAQAITDVRSAIAKGLEELDAGQGIPIEVLEQEIRGWTLK